MHWSMGHSNRNVHLVVFYIQMLSQCSVCKVRIWRMFLHFYIFFNINIIHNTKQKQKNQQKFNIHNVITYHFHWECDILMEVWSEEKKCRLTQVQQQSTQIPQIGWVLSYARLILFLWPNAHALGICQYSKECIHVFYCIELHYEYEYQLWVSQQ